MASATSFPTGMLHRWDDSQKYLSDNVHLVCEETANYLVIWCIDLEVEEVSKAWPGFRTSPRPCCWLTPPLCPGRSAR